MWTGLIVGILFGFLLKRSRLCFAGGLRDLYLEKRKTVFYAFLVIIFVQSFLFFLMVKITWLPKPQLKPFSLISIPIGSLLFGFGAILAHGCITSSLIKMGDGRFAGICSCLSFAIGATAAKQGVLKDFTASVLNLAKVPDSFITSLPFSEFFIIVPSLVLSLYLMYQNRKSCSLTFLIPYQYKGFRHIFCEKNWSIEYTAILIGVLAALAWVLSTYSGRNGGLGITTPIISWVNLLLNQKDQIDWGSFFVLGVIFGSLICSLISLEFSFQGTDGKTLLYSLIGGFLMGVGAILAQGCIVGNGLVGTAMLSMKAWLSFLFILFGLWFGAYVCYVRPYKNIRNH